MWNGQATTALKEWADKEMNKQRVAANKERIKSYNKVPVKPLPKGTPKRLHKGVMKEFIPTSKLLQMVAQGFTQTRIAQILGMSRTAVQSRLTRHKEAN